MGFDLRADFTGSADLASADPTPDGRTDFTLTAGRIDAEAEDFLGRGYCHWLAGAIHSMTGWGLTTVDGQTSDGTWLTVHTAVRTPAGRLLDIFGEHSADDVRQRYLDSGAVDVRLRDVRSEDVPGDVLTDTEGWRGNPLWWTKLFTQPHHQAILPHYGRLLLRRHGYGAHISDDATERPHHTDNAHIPGAPPTTTPVTGGNEAAMSSIDEVRATLAASNSNAEMALGMLAQAKQTVQETTGTVQLATSGSGHASIQDALGLYAQVSADIEQVIGLVNAARAATDAYAAVL